MPSLENTMCWAIPVKVDILGAHLEAYISLLPTIVTLRMCRLFGKGAEVHINKLPSELLVLVEELLTGEARSRSLETWQRDFACYEEGCGMDDHFTEKSLELYRKGMLALGSNASSEAINNYDCDWENGIVDHEGEPSTVNIHEQRVQAWIKRAAPSGLRRSDFFTDHRALVSKNFALDI